MSLVPLLREFDALNDVEQLLEDSFGLGIHPIDIFRPYERPLLLRQPRRRYNPYIVAKFQRPGRGKLDELQKSELQVPHVGKDGFQVCMDVSQFTPNELTVKTVDRTVVVEGKHEEREDEHGFIQRHFLDIRKYTLPKGYEPKDVVSTISSDGVLTVKAPPPPSKAKGKNERIVEIQQTGPAHLSVKQPEESKHQENGEADKMETK
ncbi:Heat shock protein 27 [Lucilia cuprina]|nr:Heat shock protein 27 [Lucilia cuprina]